MKESHRCEGLDHRLNRDVIQTAVLLLQVMFDQLHQNLKYECVNCSVQVAVTVVNCDRIIHLVVHVPI